MFHPPLPNHLAVIPGPERSEGARNPYSQAGVMDSGLAPSARPGMTATVSTVGATTLGFVTAPDEKSALKEAVNEFNVTDPEQQKRLVAQREG